MTENIKYNIFLSIGGGSTRPGLGRHESTLGWRAKGLGRLG